MTDLKRISVLESRSVPGVFLAMAWATSSAELAQALLEWAADRSAGKAISSAGAEGQVDALLHELNDWTWSVAENVTEGDRIAAVRQVFLAEGWLLSLDGAVAWVAARKDTGVRLVVDFSSPLADAAKPRGIANPIKLPAGTRVGGIIIPQ